MNMFQFTPPRRGRHTQLSQVIKGESFNSRPREGGDRNPWKPSPRKKRFNSRPREGGDPASAPASSAARFQFTPPRRGRLLVHEFPFTLTGSFNSRPREGGDRVSTTTCSDLDVSIHAPAKGATCPGRDGHCHCKVSIHAPAKGATGVLVSIDSFRLFQFTPPRRGRL